jgi:hypothetical protein
MLINKKYFNGMTFGQKIKYLFYYYRVIIIVALPVIVFSAFLILPLLKGKKIDAYCLILNDTGNYRLVEQITNGFPKFLNNGKYVIDVNNRYPFIYVEEQGINWPEDGANFRILSLVPNKMADVAIADYKTMLWAVYQEFVEPIDAVLPEELLERLEPYFVYAYFQGHDECDGKVYGLDISGTELMKQYPGRYKDAVIFIPNITAQPETAIHFIKYLYNIQR